MYHERRGRLGHAEAFAMGSLLLEGTPVRFAGQDSAVARSASATRRSSTTRPAQSTQPLSHAARQGQGSFWIYDSLLSEYAALGFEYGYSVHENPEALVLWEAQFGDFVNGAQIIIDQYIVAAEDKWGQTSGLVLLLPHGYEGQGPEHSSARIERFLTLCAEDNIQVCNATTAAQYFHLLRRQMRREVRKPLVVFTPKSLLRAKETARRSTAHSPRARSRSCSTTPRHPTRPRSRASCSASGKVAWTPSQRARRATARRSRWRASSSCTRGPTTDRAELARYPNAKQFVWLQEEPENMGPWTDRGGVRLTPSQVNGSGGRFRRA
jgi:2-oxoglutarate decarboxylase